MTDQIEPANPIVQRVAELVDAFEASDLVRLAIEREGERFELRRHRRVEVVPSARPEATQTRAPDRLISDLVGIVRLARPTASQGELLLADRELAYVEALGIRHPIRSRGPGRILAMPIRDGQVVEYGQTLFEIDRG